MQREFCFLQWPVKKLDDGARLMEPAKQTSSAESSRDDTLSGVLQKLTPRSHALNALQLIIDTHSLVSVSDHAGHIIYANDRFCEVSKYSREELIGPTHRILKSGYHPASFYDEMWATISSGRAWNGDIQNRAKDGSNYWVQSTISPIFDDSNQIVGYGSIRTDVTAQRQLMSDLQDSERKAYTALYSAIDILDSSILIVDASGKIVTTNKSYSDMYPESAGEECTGNYFGNLAKRQRPDFTGEKLAGYVKEVFSKNTTEQHTLADGRIVKIQRRIAPGGGFVSLHTDISDVVRQTRLLKSHSATVDLMKSIAVDANQSPDTETAYAACLKRICKYTGWEVGHVYLPGNGGSGQCYPANNWFFADNCNVMAFQKETENTRFDAGCGLPGRVLESGEAAWVRDVTTDPNFPRASAAKKSGIVGGAAFPVKIRNEVVAVLEFYSVQSIKPSPQLVEILSYVCDQVGRVAERERSEKTLMTRVAAEMQKRDQELLEQNELFDAALKNMSQGLCMYDKEQCLIVSNDRYAQMYDLPPNLLKPGITLREILEYRISKGIYGGENPEEYFEERQQWVTSGVYSNKIQELSDGRSMSITHQPMKGGGWLTTHEDITKRIAAETALQESQELFSKAFHLSPVPLSFSNPEDGAYHDINDAWTKVFGYSHAEATANSSLEMGFWVNSEDRVTFLEHIKQKNETTLGFETRIRTKSGEELNVIAHGEHVEVRGEVMLFMVFHDITERKLSEEALRASEQRFKDIVEVSSDWIWEWDEDLRVIFLSERFTQLSGVSIERVMGKTRYDLKKEGIADWDSHIADLDARKPFRGFCYSMEDENGETRHWVVNGRPIFDAAGKFKGYRGTGSDRTAEVRDQAELIRHRDHLQDLVDEATNELNQRAEELRIALEKEKELNEVQRQFVSMASHEFRTPLSIIDSAAQRLLRKIDNQTPEDATKRIEKIRGAVARMTQLMESTLAAARFEDGKISTEIGKCDLRYAILEAAMHQIELSPKHKINCELKDLPDFIMGDKGAFDQIFSNLISNAVKYSPHSSDIHVKGGQDGEFVVVEVRDHGLGIDEKDLPKMFQRFFRANTSAGIAGTGIGLNLVKTLVELHAGTINVQSQKDAGSTFTVRLPIQGPAKIAGQDGKAA